MRAFVAVEVPEPRGGAGAAPAHLTLRFLGEIDPERVEPIRARLAPVAAAHAPFELEIAGVGAFPSARAPRVVWAGVGRGREEIVRLADDVRTALAGEGAAAPEGPFVPHLTLFRVRSEADRRVAQELLNGRRAAPPAFSVPVAAFVLKESELGAGGARHRTVAEFPLSAPAGR
ncbi:MAG TPA: RNA 2',3'-cyclic phosphodiesterase [Thermoplasmata archaeon]|nr:RNA 2',3'-cyclic phosphodiesterase [Thermoplasmata archaeon]